MLPVSLSRAAAILLLIPILIVLTIQADGSARPFSAAAESCNTLDDPEQIPSPNIIDFDDLPDETVIGDYYQSAFGVIFEDSVMQRAEAVFSDLASSPPNVAMNQPLTRSGSNNSPLLIQFGEPQTYVGFFVGSSGDSGLTANLRAFDDDGNEVCFYDMEPVPDAHTLFMGVHDPAGSISSVTLDYGDTEIVESIDDLHFLAAPPPPPPTATATATATTPPTATATPSKTPTATPTKPAKPTATPIPTTDLAADDLEITQGIQNLDNEVFLVAGKRTFVRFYAHSPGGSYLTIARLKLEKWPFVTSTYIYPIAPGGPFLKVKPNYLRLLPGHAFLFELPDGYREGTVKISAELNFTNNSWHPAPNPKESNFANNLISRTVKFQQTPAVPVVIASLPDNVKATDTEYRSSFFDQWMAFSWLRRAYPVNKVQLYLRTLPVWQNATRKWVTDKDDPTKGGWALTNPTCSSVNAYLSLNKSAIINSWFYPKKIHLLGMVSDGYAFMRGCASIEAASGPAGAGDWDWDFDGTYADWYGGHELAHTYGRPHTLGELPGGCGEKNTVKQHANGTISATIDIFNRKAIFGFDPFFLKKNPILAPYWHDLMTYCPKQWVSDVTYKGLHTYIQTIYGPTGGDTAVPASKAQKVDRLAVFGSIDPQSGAIANLLPMTIWFDADDIEPRVPGPYAIVLLNAGQKELARYPFTAEDSAAGASPSGGDDLEFAAISELVPYVAGTTRVNIEGPGGVLLATVNAGLAPPTVKLLTPNGGEPLSGDPVQVSWTAADADGDPLFFNLYYSPDNGATWDPVAMAIGGTKIALPNNSLFSSSSGLLRIEASDGIHTANDVSDTVFTVPNHPPAVTIVVPETDVTIAAGQTLALEAFAYDAELGLIDDGLAWSSSLAGVLGNGVQIATAGLSPGVHLITALADDGQGGTAGDSVTVTVVATPEDLPPAADALIAAPELITLYSTGGAAVTIMGIDNQNPLNELPWRAVSNKPWLRVDPASGTTSSVVTLRAEVAGLVPGTHQAKLTISQPDGGGGEMVVPVALIFEPFKDYVPAVIR